MLSTFLLLDKLNYLLFMILKIKGSMYAVKLLTIINAV